MIKSIKSFVTVVTVCKHFMLA